MLAISMISAKLTLYGFHNFCSRRHQQSFITWPKLYCKCGHVTKVWWLQHFCERSYHNLNVLIIASSLIYVVTPAMVIILFPWNRLSIAHIKLYSKLVSQSQAGNDCRDFKVIDSEKSWIKTSFENVSDFIIPEKSILYYIC